VACLLDDGWIPFVFFSSGKWMNKQIIEWTPKEWRGWMDGIWVSHPPSVPQIPPHYLIYRGCWRHLIKPHAMDFTRIRPMVGHALQALISIKPIAWCLTLHLLVSLDLILVSPPGLLPPHFYKWI
jgi:hypothetical protein